jgi:tetratricopeptide (TPR) repeat protein
MRSLAALLVLATPAGALAAEALPFLPKAADEIELTSGSVVEGKVQDLGDSVRVTRGGASIVYPKTMIRKITPKKTVEELYEDQAKALKDADVEGRLRLARWCLEKKLPKEAAAEFRKVLAVDPEHEEARKGAGFVRHNGRWMTEDEANEAKGLVRHKGRWMTPEERNLDVALEEQKELDRQISEAVRALLERTRSSDEKRREDAFAGLAKIDDKYKVKAYLAAVSSPSRHTRKHVFEELGRMKEPAAAKPLVRRSLWDEDEALRPVAFDALKAIRHPDTALYFVPFLGEESVSARIRCVDSMAVFKDPRVAGYLLQALENCLDAIKSADQFGQPMNVVAHRTIVMRDGTVIQLPRIRQVKAEPADKEMKSKLELERVSILATLRTVTGQDFGDDPAKWRAGLRKKD